MPSSSPDAVRSALLLPLLLLLAFCCLTSLSGTFATEMDSMETNSNEIMPEVLMPRTGGRDMFRQYLSRGIFDCTAKYVSTLQKMQKMIATAHQEHSYCQRKLEKVDSSALDQSRKLIEAIGEMLDE